MTGFPILETSATGIALIWVDGGPHGPRTTACWTCKPFLKTLVGSYLWSQT